MHSPLGKAFEKQIKTIKEQGKKQVGALEVLKPEKNQELDIIEELFPKKIINNEFENELVEIKKQEKKIKGNNLIYRANKYKYDFQQYETIRSFGESIHAGEITIDEAEEDQSNLLKNIVEFYEKSRAITKEGKDKKKRDTYEKVYALYEGLELTLNAFRSGIFLINSTQGKEPKILTPKQML